MVPGNGNWGPTRNCAAAMKRQVMRTCQGKQGALRLVRRATPGLATSVLSLESQRVRQTDTLLPTNLFPQLLLSLVDGGTEYSNTILLRSMVIFVNNGFKFVIQHFRDDCKFPWVAF